MECREDVGYEEADVRKALIGLLLLSCFAVVIAVVYWTGGNLRELQNFPGSIILGLLLSVPYAFGHSEGARLLLGLRLKLRERVRFFWVQQASGLVGTLTAPQLGIPARLLLVKEFFGVPFARGSGAVVSEILLQFQIMFLFLAIPEPRFWGGAADLVALGFGLCGVVFVVSMWGFRRGTLSSVLDRVGVSRWPHVTSFIQTAERSARDVESWQLLRPALWFIFCFLVDAVCLVFFLKQGGVDVSVVSIVQVGIVTYVVSTLSMIPFGAGVRDISFIALLGWIGVPAPLAALAAFYQRFLRTLVPLALGVIGVGYLGVERINRLATLAEEGSS